MLKKHDLGGGSNGHLYATISSETTGCSNNRASD